jgi:hypothetical protein
VRRVLIILAVVLTTAPILNARPAAASCAAQTIEVSPASGPAGSTVIVAGKGFYVCQDVITCPQTGPCDPPPPTPVPDIHLFFSRGEGQPSVELGRTSGPDFSVQVTIPISARRGPALIGATYSQPHPFQVTSGAGPERRLLPRTGFPTMASLTLVGSVLIAAGLASVRLARRSFYA